MCPFRVLVVDDNADMRESLVMVLEALGHRALAFDSGIRALDALREADRSGESFGVALVDVEMPGMSGYELVAALRQDGIGASVPIVALTGWVTQSDRERAIEAGFDAHLAKPVDLQALRELLKRLESGVIDRAGHGSENPG